MNSSSWEILKKIIIKNSQTNLKCYQFNSEFDSLLKEIIVFIVELYVALF